MRKIYFIDDCEPLSVEMFFQLLIKVFAINFNRVDIDYTILWKCNSYLHFLDLESYYAEAYSLRGGQRCIMYNQAHYDKNRGFMSDKFP